MRTCKLPRETIAAIRKAKWSGLSLLEIAGDFDIDKGTASKYTSDIPVKAKAGRRAEYDQGKVLSLLRQGLPLTVIKERLGISRARAYRICMEHYGVAPSELHKHLSRKQWKAAA